MKAPRVKEHRAEGITGAARYVRTVLPLRLLLSDELWSLAANLLTALDTMSMHFGFGLTACAQGPYRLGPRSAASPSGHTEVTMDPWNL